MSTLSMAEKLTPISLSSNPNYNGMISSFIMGGNGTFMYTKNWLCERLLKDGDYTINSSLPQVEEYVVFNKQIPQIPLEAFEMVLAYYKEIYDRFGTEAQVNFYWNENHVDSLQLEDRKILLEDVPNLINWGNGLYSHTPEQRNSAGLTTQIDEYYEYLKSQLRPIVETHSHNTMSAFKSATDEANSNFDCLQLVFGRITSKTYDFYNWLSISGKQYDQLDLEIISQIVELPESFENKDYDELPEVPQSWFDASHSYQQRVKFREFDSSRRSFDEEQNLVNSYFESPYYEEDYHIIYEDEGDEDYDSQIGEELEQELNKEKEKQPEQSEQNVDKQQEQIQRQVQTNQSLLAKIKHKINRLI